MNHVIALVTAVTLTAGIVALVVMRTPPAIKPQRAALVIQVKSTCIQEAPNTTTKDIGGAIVTWGPNCLPSRAYW